LLGDTVTSASASLLLHSNKLTVSFARWLYTVPRLPSALWVGAGL
jgi:hypothetical protein